MRNGDKRAIARQVLITGTIAILFALFPGSYDSWTLAAAISDYHRNPTSENQQRVRIEQDRAQHAIRVIEAEHLLGIFLFANACYSIRRPRVAALFFLAFCTATLAFCGFPIPRSAAKNGAFLVGALELDLWQFQLVLVGLWGGAFVSTIFAFAWHAFKRKAATQA